MNPKARILGLVILAAFLLPGLVPTASATVDLTFEARESDCEDGTFCFELTSGSLDDLQPGEDVHVTFENGAQTVHNVFATTKAEMDPQQQQTDGANALGNTSQSVAPGASDTFNFTIPDDATGVYFWCDIAGHEQMGMWVLADFEADSGGDAGESPSPGIMTFLLAIVGAAFVLRRRD